MKNYILRLSAIFVCVLMAVSLFAGCSDDSSKKTDVTTAPTENITPVIDITAAPSTEIPKEDPTDAPTENPTENPTAIPDNSVSLADFVKQFGGTWTSSDDEFIKIGEEEGITYILFAAWNAGGDFPVGTVEGVKKQSEKEYEISMSFDGNAASKYIFTSKTDDTVTFGTSGDTAITYTFYANRQFPITTQEISPADFAEDLAGNWTEKTGNEERIRFWPGEGMGFMSMGRWSDELEETGEIVTCTLDSDGATYNLEVSWYANDDMGMSAHVDYYTLVKSSSDTFDLYFSGMTEPYSYYLDSDDHVTIPDISMAALMTEDEILDYLGECHGRMLAEWWAEYIVKDDDIFVTYKDPVSGKKFKCMCNDSYVLVAVIFL